MPGEEFSSTLVVEIDGQPLSEQPASRLTSATIDDSLTVPDLFVLRFLDEEGKVLDQANAKVGSVVKIKVQRSGQAAPLLMLEGEVTALETEVTATGTRTVIRGYDKTHRLFRRTQYRSFVDQSASDIVRATASAAGLQVGTLDAGTEVFGYLSQDGCSDWELLQRLAARTGAVVTVRDGRLDVRRADSAATAPGSGTARENELVIEKGVNLVSVRATVTAAGQVPEVTVRAWDTQAKKVLTGTAPARTTSASVDGVDPANLAKSVSASAAVLSRPTLSKPGCDSLARAEADRVAGSHAELEGVARGNPALRAGAAVKVAGIGKAFDGRYTLTSTRHEFTKDRGYLTGFTVSNRSDRSAYGLVTAGAGAGYAGGTAGVAVGLVSDVKDPLRIGRVKVTFPTMSDTHVSAWARTVHVGAGPSRGSLILPEVGDEVLVAFGQGDLDDPYVLGGLYNGKDKPWSSPDASDYVDGGNGKIARRGLVSRTGMVIDLVESANDEKLCLTTNGGKQRITLAQKSDAAIEIVSEGPVTVTAKKDVSVKTSGGNIDLAASSGNVTVKGTAVTLEATNALELKGANVKVTGQASAEVKAATVKVEGQGTAELSASGATTVKGGIVKIN
jgi:uncharacterized protein involved in type VI secretion and phage assembly